MMAMMAATTEPGSLRFLVNPAAGRGTGRAHLDRIRVLASKLGAGLCVSRKVADLAEKRYVFGFVVHWTSFE